MFTFRPETVASSLPAPDIPGHPDISISRRKLEILVRVRIADDAKHGERLSRFRIFVARESSMIGRRLPPTSMKAESNSPIAALVAAEFA